jgi:hypothetical protein
MSPSGILRCLDVKALAPLFSGDRSRRRRYVNEPIAPLADVGRLCRRAGEGDSPVEGGAGFVRATELLGWGRV